MNELQLYLLGLPRVEFRGNPVRIERRKALALAAYLALSDHAHRRDMVADLLWPALDRDHGRSALRSTLRALTTAIPLEWIEADRTTLRLRRDMVSVDVHAFMALLAGNETHGHSLDAICDDCVTLYKQALALYQSDFMSAFSLSDSVDYDDWQLSQREWLCREFADILRRLSDYYATTQQYAQALRYAQQWLASDTLHEPAQRQLMRLYAASGQSAEAIRQYKQWVETLDLELAAPPEPETIQLYEAIQNKRVTMLVKDDAILAVSVLPPMPSLVVGREDALREIKRRLGIGGGEMRPLTVIQGWPGVGKSTTVAMLAHDPE